MTKRIIDKTLFEFLILLMALVGIFTGLKQINWLDIFGLQKINPNAEIIIGDKIWEYLQESEEVDDDSLQLRVLDTMVTRICSANKFAREYIKIHVLDNNEVNAFASAGGHLIVYNSMFEQCNTPEELAGVLAHEIAHIQENHVSRKLYKEVGLSVIVALTTGNGGGGETLKKAIQFITSSAYDRKLEKQADLKGIEYLYNANIDPRGLPQFMKTMSKENADLPEFADWFSTHPDTEARIEYMKDEIKLLVDKKYQPLIDNQTWQKVHI